MRFLIIKPSSLGDVLHTFPAVHMLAKAYPDAHIDWVIHSSLVPLLEYEPDVAHVIPFYRARFQSLAAFPREACGLVRSLRVESYDAVFDLQGLFRSALFGWLCRCRNVYGPACPKEQIAGWLYSHRLSAPDSVLHALERNCHMMAQFLGRGVDSSDFSYSVPVLESHRRSAVRLLQSGFPDFEMESGATRLIAVAPGARWLTKQWPPSFFAQAMQQIYGQRSDVRFVLLGSPSEQSAAAEIVQKTQGLPIADLCGRTSLPEMIEILRCSSGFLCNDSGPMHAAALLQIPVVALFGATSPALTGPYCKESAVLQPSLDCIQCFKRYCDTMKCHAALSASDAAQQIVNFLGRE